jgi:hypothetical protein
MTKLIVLRLVTGLALVAILSTACDGYLGMTGFVYEQACPGFIPMIRVFDHDRFKHEALVTMVRAK